MSQIDASVHIVQPVSTSSVTTMENGTPVRPKATT